MSAPRDMAVMGLTTSIFSEEWWCKAASDNRCEQVVYVESQAARASLRYVRHRSRGLAQIAMPYLSRTIEPVFEMPPCKPVMRIQNQVRLLRGLLSQLPRTNGVRFVLAPDSELELPFILNGFSATTKYTFRCGQDYFAWDPSHMEQKQRNALNNASKMYGVEVSNDFDVYERLARDQWKGSSHRDLNEYARIRAIWTEASARSKAVVIVARAPNNRPVAACILVYDASVLYYWLSARALGDGGHQANALLIKSAVDYAQDRGLTFDVDGFASVTSGAYLAKFGLAPARRVEVVRLNRLAKITHNLSGLVRP